MPRSLSAGRVPARRPTPTAARLAALVVVTLACGAGGGGLDTDALIDQAQKLAREAATRYESTPPADRVTWGGLGAAAVLGAGALLGRMARLKTRKVLPTEFTNRFLTRLQDGKLDRGKALDYCELNPSPAARVALAAVRRWGRPTADLERAAALAQRVEADRLRRNVATLRRVAALTPLIGLLGTLLATARVLATSGTAASWGPGLASALSPLTAGVALSVLALVAYDGLAGRVEALVASLDRVGAETIDAIAMAMPPAEARPSVPHPAGPARTPHSHPIRIEVPDPSPRKRVDPEDFD